MQRRKTIKYVGFYDFPRSNSNRVSCLAATNKMDYVCSAIVRAGYNVEIISPSWMGKESRKRQERQNTVKVDDNISVTFCPSWRTRRKIAGYVKIIFSLIWLFLYLLMNARRDEKILVYHSPWLSTSIRWAKFLKRFTLILEVEEIYGDVSVIHSIFIPLEYKLLYSADEYIYSTELLMNRINNIKPHLVLYGAYEIPEIKSHPDNDGKIHLLYAGIIDSHKRGAFNAVESTKYLPAQYMLHIIGFGDTKKLCKRIAELNLTNECKITYDGMKSDSDYVSYCQKCHIGLSTQSMGGVYLLSSFPSKILSYLSLGLRVISCHVDCVSKSKIGDVITYYYKDTPEAIADAVMSIDFSQPYDSISRIKELDKQFVVEIGELLEG